MCAVVLSEEMGSGTSISLNNSIEKKKGDDAYREGHYIEAILWYSIVINEMEREKEAREENKEIERKQDEKREEKEKLLSIKLSHEIAIVLSNRSSAYLLTGQSQRALNDALRVIEIDPLWAKGYYRAAKAFESCQRVVESVDYYQKAMALSENDRSLVEEFQNLKKLSQITFSQGNVFTWGLGDSYGLGHAEVRDKQTPTMVEQLRGRHVVDISCGAMHTVAVTGTGDVLSWGQNKYGQVGIQSHEIVLVPTFVGGLFGVFIEAVSCGAGHTIAKSSDGRVFSWGMGGYGQLGHGNLENLPAPTQILSLQNDSVLGISCGIAHTVFLVGDSSQHTVLGCGMNTYGALGLISSTTSVSLPTKISLPSQYIRHISCGGAHTALVDESGILYMTGSNTCGQLGLSKNFSNDFISTFCPVETVVIANQTSIVCPRFVYVSCGEEFTIAITSDHQVYSTGLGLSGQMANNTQENNFLFTHIALLDSHKVEEICCSQGTVYAITSAGAVWTWGIPGNEYRQHIASLEVKSNGSSFENYLTPALVTNFSRRKKVRMIRCGRKHYAALTRIPYGPTSFLTIDKQRMNSNNFQDIVLIGKKMKGVVCCCDSSGEFVDFSGTIVNGNLQLIETEDTIHWGKDPIGIPLVIDDNFDGTFTIQSSERIEVSGDYRLSVMIDGLHIDGSPFQLTVPSEIVSKMTLQFQIDQVPITTFRINQAINLKISFMDRFGNMKPSFGTDPFCELEIKLTDDDSAVFSTIKTRLMTENLGMEKEIYVPFQTPPKYGRYDCIVSLTVITADEKCIVKETTHIHLEGTNYSPLQCIVSFPPKFTVDQDIMFTIHWKDGDGEDLTVSPLDGSCSPKIISTITPIESNISARALIRLYTWGQDPCKPVQGNILWNQNNSCFVNISHRVRISGLAEAKIIIDNYIIHTSQIIIECGNPSSLYTELLNPKNSLCSWNTNEEKRELDFQARDQFGNISTKDIDVTAYEWIEGNEMNQRELMIEKRRGGLFSIQAVKLSEDDSVMSWIDVSISLPNGREKLQYSPFCLGSSSDPILQSKISSNIAQDEKDQVTTIETLTRLELTKKRAAEALKEKQRFLREEKERNRIKKAARRTGGGFIIQYSKEV